LENAHRIVSSEAEELILVDEDDQEIGFLSKADCHNGTGQLHRAFSVFLFNASGELLMQKRSDSKRLWPGFWSNTCCSHPRRGESMPVATGRRLRDELNIEASLEFIYKFSYQAEFDSTGSENELCHIYLGMVGDAVAPNDHEISAVRYLSADGLTRAFNASPGHFTPWFKMEWMTLVEEYRDDLSRYCSL
jgi:isopentenyl-diphosphate delta-isomerase